MDGHWSTVWVKSRWYLRCTRAPWITCVFKNLHFALRSKNYLVQKCVNWLKRFNIAPVDCLLRVISKHHYSLHRENEFHITLTSSATKVCTSADDDVPIRSSLLHFRSAWETLNRKVLIVLRSYPRCLHHYVRLRSVCRCLPWSPIRPVCRPGQSGWVESSQFSTSWRPFPERALSSKTVIDWGAEAMMSSTLKSDFISSSDMVHGRSLEREQEIKRFATSKL